MLELFQILANDALATTKRMRDDARHLRELGTRAKVGAKFVIGNVREKATRTLENVADGLLELERRYGARE